MVARRLKQSVLLGYLRAGVFLGRTQTDWASCHPGRHNTDCGNHGIGLGKAQLRARSYHDRLSSVALNAVLFFSATPWSMGDTLAYATGSRGVLALPLHNCPDGNPRQVYFPRHYLALWL